MSPSKSLKLEPAPWVRIFRHEAFTEPQGQFDETSDLYAIDVVHKDFFENYLIDHIFPFADIYTNKIKKHTEILLSGAGHLKKKQKNKTYDELFVVKSPDPPIIDKR